MDGDLEIIGAEELESDAEPAEPDPKVDVHEVVLTILTAVAAFAIVLAAVAQVRIVRAEQRTDCRARAFMFRPSNFTGEDVHARMRAACGG